MQERVLLVCSRKRLCGKRCKNINKCSQGSKKWGDAQPASNWRKGQVGSRDMDGVNSVFLKDFITHLEPDILECEVKRALGY